MSDAACIQRCPTTTRSPWSPVRAAPEVRLEHRRAGLLDLQEQRIVARPALQHEDVAARPDAADADHLAGEVERPEVVEQVAPVGRQAAPVRGEPPADEVGDVGAVGLGRQVLDQRRIVDDHAPAVDHPGQGVEGLQAGVAPRPADRARDGAPGPGGAQHAGHVVDRHVRVPDRERPHPGRAPDRAAVRRGAARGRAALGRGEAVGPPGEHEAGGEALEVPLERARQRLVEVVDVEQERALRRGEHPEVHEVGVAAELHRQRRPRQRGQVHRHHGGGAAEEGERRREHPPVAEGDEVREPAGVLRLEDVDRAPAVGRGAPRRVRPPGERLPKRLPAPAPLLHAQLGGEGAPPPPAARRARSPEAR